MANVHLEQAGEFFRRFFRFGGTLKMVIELLTNDVLMERWVKNLASEPVFRLIHGKYNTLADKIAIAKSYPGVNPEEVDVAVALAHKSGLIAGYEKESPKNEGLEIVISVFKEDVPATLKFVRERIKDTFVGTYQEWAAAYANGVDENRVKMLEEESFVPNSIKVEVLDLHANFNPKGVILGEVQKTQAGKLAGFAVLYAACQSPEWVKQMDGVKTPYAIAAAILLNVSGYGLWAYSPLVSRDGQGAVLFGDHVAYSYDDASFPVLREYVQS